VRSAVPERPCPYPAPVRHPELIVSHHRSEREATHVLALANTAAYSEILGQAFPDERPRLEANVEAAGLSRMCAGIHYRFDIEAGQLLGRQVAEYVLRTDVNGHEPIPLE
jgi:hypothetical protein